MPFDLRARLAELKLDLPPAPAAVADYVPARIAGDVLYVSGQLPMREGELVATGPVPDVISLEQAQAAARQCILNGLAAADAALEGDWSRFEAVARVGVFVASAAGFTQQHLVANGASGLLGEVFAERGRHARAAVGVSALPLGASVEVEIGFALTRGGTF